MTSVDPTQAPAPTASPRAEPEQDGQGRGRMLGRAVRWATPGARTKAGLRLLARPLGWLWHSYPAKAWLLLLILLSLFGYCRWAVTASLHDVGVDGGYYASVALQVRDGNGLTTNVSILHKGDLSFPAPTSIYPLWPLVWGYTARLLPIPLADVGLGLAGLLYVTALLFAYLWGSGLYPRPLFPRLVPGLNVGHVFVVVLGLSALFVSTSEPYVEGLAYTLMFAAFWRSNTLLRRPSWKAGLELGIWLALILLTRPQLVITAPAAAIVLGSAALFAHASRGRYAVMLLTCAATYTVVVAPWPLYVWSFSPDASLFDILKFATVRSSDTLSSLESFPHDRRKDLWGVLLDRLSGFAVAFDWANRKSYARRFFVFHYAVLAVLPFGVYAFVRWMVRGELKRSLGRLRCPQNAPAVFAFVYGLGAFLALHAVHTNSGWYFGRRHSLGAVVLISLMLAYLLLMRGTVGYLARFVGLALLVVGAWRGTPGLVNAVRKAERRGPSAKSALVLWLQRKEQEIPNLVVADRQPQHYAYQLPKVGFHYYGGRTKRSDFEAMATRLGVDIFLVPKKQLRSWAHLGREFKKVGYRGGRYVYEPKPSLKRQIQSRKRKR